MYFIDEKVSVWYRYSYDTKEELDAAILRIKKGEGISDFITSDELDETITDMSVEENGGCATIEAYHDDLLLWTNTMEE